MSTPQIIKNLEMEIVKLKSQIHILKNTIFDLNQKIYTYENLMKLKGIEIPKIISNINENKNNNNPRLPKRKRHNYNNNTNYNLDSDVLENKTIINLELDDVINIKKENDFKIGNLYFEDIKIPNDITEINLSNNYFEENNYIDIDEMSYEQLLDLENRIGNVKKGINNISKLKLKTVKFSSYNSKDKECVICKELFNENEYIRLLNCSHIFHINCIDKWFKDHKICPICKKEVK
jgi:hypothetical protein